jgi:serine protease Do
MRADEVSWVARERAGSVVLLHAVVREHADDSGAPAQWFVHSIREVLGSGIVIDRQGLILTNAHVVERTAAIHVRRPDGEDVQTTLVGTDSDSDLALVRVSDATGLTPAPLGDSDLIEVGSHVVAIGSPLGFHHTVTAGVLSAKARDLDDSGMEFLQTDAAVNPGSSGGPLFDLSGRVIGVITAIVSGAGDNVGLNFAIPINEVKAVLPALRTNSVTRAWLGMLTARLTQAGAEALGLANAGEGLLVTAVESDGPAAHGGVLPGDVLLGMAGDPAVEARDVFRRIRTMPAGSSVRLKILRDRERMELTVVLETRPSV